MMPPRGPANTRSPGPVPNPSEMIAQQGHQLWVDGHQTSVADRAMLEFAPFAGLAAVGPLSPAARLGVRQPQFTPALLPEGWSDLARRRSMTSSGRRAA